MLMEASSSPGYVDYGGEGAVARRFEQSPAEVLLDLRPLQPRMHPVLLDIYRIQDFSGRVFQSERGSCAGYNHVSAISRLDKGRKEPDREYREPDLDSLEFVDEGERRSTPQVSSEVESFRRYLAHEQTHPVCL